MRIQTDSIFSSRPEYAVGVLIMALGGIAVGQEYSAYSTWDAMDKATDAEYAAVTRVSGTAGHTGFWFFGIEQFDATDRYVLAMTVHCRDREVRQDDVADIGYFDLQNGKAWTRIGTTTAWNWQQGCRSSCSKTARNFSGSTWDGQLRPGSESSMRREKLSMTPKYHQYRLDAIEHPLHDGCKRHRGGYLGRDYQRRRRWLLRRFPRILTTGKTSLRIAWLSASTR